MQQNSASVDCSTLIAEVPLQRDVELKPSAVRLLCSHDADLRVLFGSTLAHLAAVLLTGGACSSFEECNQRCHLVAIDSLETVNVDLVAFW